MTNKNELKKLKPKIIKILKSRGIRKAGIFGSFAKNEQRKNSDIDILIQPSENMSLLGFVEVKLELEDKLGKKIDLISYKGIHPLLRTHILKEEIRLI